MPPVLCLTWSWCITLSTKRTLDANERVAQCFFSPRSLAWVWNTAKYQDINTTPTQEVSPIGIDRCFEPIKAAAANFSLRPAFSFQWRAIESVGNTPSEPRDDSTVEEEQCQMWKVQHLHENVRSSLKHSRREGAPVEFGCTPLQHRLFLHSGWSSHHLFGLIGFHSYYSALCFIDTPPPLSIKTRISRNYISSVSVTQLQRANKQLDGNPVSVARL